MYDVSLHPPRQTVKGLKYFATQSLSFVPEANEQSWLWSEGSVSAGVPSAKGQDEECPAFHCPTSMSQSCGHTIFLGGAWCFSQSRCLKMYTYWEPICLFLNVLMEKKYASVFWSCYLYAISLGSSFIWVFRTLGVIITKRPSWKTLSLPPLSHSTYNPFCNNVEAAAFSAPTQKFSQQYGRAATQMHNKISCWHRQQVSQNSFLESTIKELHGF